MGRNSSGPPPAQERSRKTIKWRIGVYEKLLKSNLRRRGPLCGECQLQVVYDPVEDGMLREEGDDAHRAAAAGQVKGLTL